MTGNFCRKYPLQFFQRLLTWEHELSEIHYCQEMETRLGVLQASASFIMTDLWYLQVLNTLLSVTKITYIVFKFTDLFF